MRILFISRCPPYPLHLGDRLIIAHLTDELEARRHRLDLLAFYNRPEDPQQQGRYEMRFENVQLFPELRRSSLSYLQRLLLPGRRFPHCAERSWSPEMWRAIEERITRANYDVVHLFGGIQVYEYWRALGNLPIIITPYESYSLYLRRMVEAQPRAGAVSLATWLQWRTAQQYESWMFAPYRRVVVVSRRDRDELLRLNPRLAVEVIPNGIDLHFFRRRQTELKLPAMLFVGNYEYAPNVDAALRLAREILPRVQARIPQVRLWLVGNAPPPEVQRLASQAIKVTGRVPDVRPYLARATAFVCPLQLGAGIKNKILEALAIGCPVVATPLSLDGIDAADEREALVGDGEAMTEAIVRLFGDRDLQRRLADNGRALVERQYGWTQVAARYEALYQEMMQ